MWTLHRIFLVSRTEGGCTLAQGKRGVVEQQRTVPLCPVKAQVGDPLPLLPTLTDLGLDRGWSLGTWLRPSLAASWPLGDLEPALASAWLLTQDRSLGHVVASVRELRVCPLQDPSTPHITRPIWA